MFHSDCGDPAPQHGSVNSSATTNGTVVEVSCEDGYELLGEAVIMCQPSEEWTDNSSCAIKGRLTENKCFFFFICLILNLT